MGTDLAVRPNNIKEYVEGYLRTSGPSPGRWMVTNIKGEVEAVYAWAPNDFGNSSLYGVEMSFAVSALCVTEKGLELELIVKPDSKGVLHIEALKLTAYRSD